MITPANYLAVPGIRAETEDVRGWWARAEAWIEAEGRGCAAHFAYHTYALTRWLEQGKHVRRLTEKIRQRRMFHLPTRLICHSNGAVLALESLRDNPGLVIDELHLIASAADADCEKNGLNLIVGRGQVRRVVVYCSKGDGVLKGPAKWSKRLFGWAGLGYGQMGLEGPENQSDQTQSITELVREDLFGHSTWLQGEELFRTMRRITGGD